MKNHGSADLTTYLNNIKQDHVILIDEFEKIYPQSWDSNDNEKCAQEQFLNFLDNGGAEINVKRMFIITANDEFKINSFMKNRPSRIRYYKKYKRIEDSIIKEIASDLLVNQDFKQDLIDNVPYEQLNIDALIQIIKEINAHNQPYSAFKDFFNLSETTTDKKCEVIVVEEGRQVSIKQNLLSSSLYQNFYLGKYKGHPIYLDEGLEVDASSLEQIESIGYYKQGIEKKTVNLIIKISSNRMYDYAF